MECYICEILKTDIITTNCGTIVCYNCATQNEDIKIVQFDDGSEEYHLID